MSINRIRTLVASDLNAVDELINVKIRSEINLINELTRHIMQSGGKKLRPLLIILASRACGYTDGNKHITMAAMIEFFHTATLLHDDVVDESTLRRGRETANEIWGPKASILVGDYLFTQHMKLLLDVNNIAIMHHVADTAWHIGRGEIKQLANRYNPALSVEEYFEVIRAKTSLLFAACAKLGALVTDKEQILTDNLYNYGLHLGNAFQLIDDVLDYCADPETTGKNIGDDLANGKATLPLLHALKHGNKRQQEMIIQSLTEGSLEHLSEIQLAISDTNAIAYTRTIAKKEVDSAISSLQMLPDSVYKEALASLAQYAMERDH